MRSVGALWTAPVCVPSSDAAKDTVKTETIETGARMLELPLLVRSGDLSHGIFSPQPKGGNSGRPSTSLSISSDEYPEERIKNAVRDTCLRCLAPQAASNGFSVC